MDKVILNKRGAFGGSRIAQGQVSVDLWSDGAVLGAAWTTAQPEIGGLIFSFRGRLERRPWAPRSRGWALIEDNGGYVSGFATRMAALDRVERTVVNAAFRELNRVEAAR